MLGNDHSKESFFKKIDFDSVEKFNEAVGLKFFHFASFSKTNFKKN